MRGLAIRDRNVLLDERLLAFGGGSNLRILGQDVKNRLFDQSEDRSSIRL